MTVIRKGYSPIVTTQKTTKLSFSGSAEQLANSIGAGQDKDTTLFQDRSDVSLDQIQSTLLGGQDLLLIGTGGCGKSMLLQASLKQLKTSGVPVFPEQLVTTGRLLMDPKLKTDLATFLEVNKTKPNVVVGLDEVMTGLFLPGTVDSLKRIKTQYPNVRFLATQDRYGVMNPSLDDEDLAFFNNTFQKRQELAAMPNLFEQFTGLLAHAGFQIPDHPLQAIRGYIEGQTGQNNLGVRKYIQPLILALQQKTDRQDDSKTIEPLDQDTLKQAFPEVFGKP